MAPSSRWRLFLSLFLTATTTMLLTKVGADAAAMKRVVVIGGGAAGYFSSIECARTLREHKVPATVTVLEAGRKPLSKVLISGGGRCNVMHDPTKGSNLIAKGYPRGSKELLSPFNKNFGPWETFEWFSSRLPPGATLKTEADGRVFPSTDSSTTIADALTLAAQHAKVDVRCGARVVSVAKKENGGGFTVSYVTSTEAVFDSVANSRLPPSAPPAARVAAADPPGAEADTDSASPRRDRQVTVLECDRLIVATGSARGGYEMLRQLGHSLVDPLPSLFSFKVADPALRDLAGASVQHSTVRLVLPKDFAKVPTHLCTTHHTVPNRVCNVYTK
jgi:hypothetical protein